MEANAFGFELAGFGSGDMTWHVPQPGRYEVVVSEGERQARSVVERQPDGTITIGLTATAPLRARVRVTRLAGP